MVLHSPFWWVLLQARDPEMWMHSKIINTMNNHKYKTNKKKTWLSYRFATKKSTFLCHIWGNPWNGTGLLNQDVKMELRCSNSCLYISTQFNIKSINFYAMPCLLLCLLNWPPTQRIYCTNYNDKTYSTKTKSNHCTIFIFLNTVGLLLIELSLLFWILFYMIKLNLQSN